MDITTEKLRPEMADKYIEYFDNRAFSDGSAEKGCYCVWHHWTDAKEQERGKAPVEQRPFFKRDYARELITCGRLNGFAAFCGGDMVGFCNADDKSRYFRLSRENAPDTWTGLQGGERVLSVVCFIVAPDMRRKGIASALLESACRYAEEKGFDYIEGYPSSGEFKVTDCGGARSMFTALGFDIIGTNGGIIARKKLREKKGE